MVAVSRRPLRHRGECGLGRSRAPRTTVPALPTGRWRRLRAARGQLGPGRQRTRRSAAPPSASDPRREGAYAMSYRSTRNPPPFAPSSRAAMAGSKLRRVQTAASVRREAGRLDGRDQLGMQAPGGARHSESTSDDGDDPGTRDRRDRRAEAEVDPRSSRAPSRRPGADSESRNSISLIGSESRRRRWRCIPSTVRAGLRSRSNLLYLSWRPRDAPD
jgi:hypothetical protein